ncbi:MAG: hypothetical protein H6556_17010 [Lewinellaceae bacterium]|nr:hypothetical protein [Lewinellaceae bacterium]
MDEWQILGAAIDASTSENMYPLHLLLPEQSVTLEGLAFMPLSLNHQLSNNRPPFRLLFTKDKAVPVFLLTYRFVRLYLLERAAVRGSQFAVRAESRIPNPEHRIPNTKHRTPNTEQ